MRRPPELEGRTGLALLLPPPAAPVDNEDEIAALRGFAQTFGRRLAETLFDLYGLRAGFAFDPAAPAPEPGPGLTAWLRGPDGHARFELGQTAIYDFIEALFGGDGSVAAYRERRPLTELEKAIGSALAPHFAEALGEAIGRPGVIFERLAEADEEETPGAADAVPLAVRMRLVGRDSRFVLHCPRAWLGFPDLSPVVSEKGPDVEAVEIDLKISLLDQGRTLGELLGLVEGAVLPLNLPASAPARVEADGVRLFDAALGQSGGRYTIRIERAPDGDASAFGSNAA